MDKAYQICIEMFQQRGYVIIDSDEDRILANKEDGNQICAFFTIHKFNIDRLQEYISTMKKMDVWHCVIVFKENATPVAKKIVLDSKEMVIELFEQDEMQYNLTKHYLVPKHEKILVNASNSSEFKKATVDKFPIILKSDPVSRFYAYSRGDIIKITRKNGFVSFRRVV